METILVTGGAGFVGGTFVRQLVARGDVRVINLDRLTYAGNLDSLAAVFDHPNHHFVHGDIADGKLVGELLAEHQCAAIVNFAAESHVDRSIGCPRAFVRTNVVGTFELLETALAYWESLDDEPAARFRLLHVSTDEVFGSLGPAGQFSERTSYRPSSPYSASKAASDHFVQAYGRTYGLPTLITNCSSNYGPYQYPEKLIPLAILCVLENKPIPVYGTGENVRDWIHVDDHCRALWEVLRRGSPGESYTIGGGCELTNLAVVEQICHEVDRLNGAAPSSAERLIRHVSDRPGHDFRYAVDTRKIREQLDWRPQIDFATGLAETIRWYRDNMDWVLGAGSSDTRRDAHAALNRDQGSRPSRAPRSAAESAAATTIEGVSFRPLTRWQDDRHWVTEVFGLESWPAGRLPLAGQMRETPPGVAQGPRQLRGQTEYLAFGGLGDFRVYLWDARRQSPTFGAHVVRTVGQSDPQAVIVPPGVVHAYKNVGDQPGVVFNLASRDDADHDSPLPSDEIAASDLEGGPYELLDEQPLPL